MWIFHFCSLFLMEKWINLCLITTLLIAKVVNECILSLLQMMCAKKLLFLKGIPNFWNTFPLMNKNSCCTIWTAAVLMLRKTLCRFMMNCCEQHCDHLFTLHGTQSITNRKLQRRSLEAPVNWPVDLHINLVSLYYSPPFAWS